MYWNPATISGLPGSELEVGVDLVAANHRVSSTFGPLSGSTEDNPGFTPAPNIGWVHRGGEDLERWTFGLGVNMVAGFKTNLQVDPTNPILAPPASGGLGRVSSEAMFFQFAPVASYAVTEQVAVAVGPTITMAQVSLEPFVFGAPNTDGTYASAKSVRYHWGGGVQAGVYYIYDEHTHFGASFKSPTWMETFRAYGENADGSPRRLEAELDLPLIVSLGAAYTGVEDYVFAVDIRYFDYASADLFGDPAVHDASGGLQGLDWSSVMSVALGVQRRIDDALLVRAGYSFNQSPIRDAESMVNVASPLLYQHLLNLGGSWWLDEHTSLNVGYAYAIPSSVEGPIVMPGVGALPGTSVRNETDAHLFGLSITKRS